MEVQESRILSMAETSSCWKAGIFTKKKGTISSAENAEKNNISTYKL
jgi:hypothetical protein